MTTLRPMRDADVAAAHELTTVVFADLGRRLHRPTPPPTAPAAAHVRLRRILATDPAGAWVAEDAAGALAGVALAIVRDGLWGLSLLVVHPDAQSGGLGRALLERALAYGNGAHGGVILASADPRALRAYVRAGFTLHPSAEATGVPRDVAAAPEVRPFEPGDHALAAAVDRAVRGVPHGADLDAMAAGGAELLAFPGRGYAAHKDGTPKLIAAHDDEAAAALLRSVLARAPDGTEVEVGWLTAAQQWAVDVAVAARLELRLGGGILLRGDVRRFRPYLPSGAYL
jgi:GNAT superfamily N-acetyltransferase